MLQYDLVQYDHGLEYYRFQRMNTLFFKILTELTHFLRIIIMWTNLYDYIKDYELKMANLCFRKVLFFTLFFTQNA
jgi:hypothetical protein